MATHAAACRMHDAPEGEYVSERDCDCGARIADLEAENAALRSSIAAEPSIDVARHMLDEQGKLSKELEDRNAELESCIREMLDAADELRAIALRYGVVV